MYDPDNGWRPWPEQRSYDRDWLARYRAAQVERVAWIDVVAKAALADSEDARVALAGVDKRGRSPPLARLRARAVATRYLTIYRTLADPAHLDLSIDPDARAARQPLRVPDPLDAQLRLGRARPDDDGPGLVVDLVRPVERAPAGRHHAPRPGADAPRAPDGRHRDPRAPGQRDRHQRRRGRRHLRRDGGRAALPFEGHRPRALSHVAEWMAARFP